MSGGVFSILLLLLVAAIVGVVAIASIAATIVAIISMVPMIEASLRKSAKRRRQKREAFAAEIGGRYKGWAFYLPMRDREVKLQGRNTGGDAPQSYTEVAWTVSFPVPSMKISAAPVLDLGALFGAQDIKVGDPQFDKPYRISGRTQEVRSLLQETLRREIEDLRGLDTSRSHLFKLQVSNVGSRRYSRITIHLPGRDVPEDPALLNTRLPTVPGRIPAILQKVEAITESLESSFWGPWKEAAELGLTLDESEDGPGLAGEINGCPVRVTLTVQNKVWLTEIHIGVQGPSGLHLIHKDLAPAKVEQISVNNPFVGRMLSITADNAPALVSLFQEQAFIDNVLPLLHGYKGSEITEDGITVRVKSRLVPTLPELIQQALTAAEYLQQNRGLLPKEALPDASSVQAKADTVKDS